MSSITKTLYVLDSIITSPEFLSDPTMKLELAAKLPEWGIRIQEAGVVDWRSRNKQETLLLILSDPIKRTWNLEELSKFTNGHPELIQKVLKLEKLDSRFDKQSMSVIKLYALSLLPKEMQWDFYQARLNLGENALTAAVVAAKKQIRKEARLRT